MAKTIGDVCNIVTGKLDANQAVKDGRYPFFTCAEFPESIDRYAFDDDVVLIAGNNARGNFHVSRYNGKFNAYQRTYVLTTKHGYDIDYIYYALKLELKRLREKSQGSQTKFLTMPILTSIPLGNLDETEYPRVSSVLKCLDKKIDLNNRINAELESMAKTLYDYWFVQFDFPDANGKPYKTSGGKMVYNATLKREIPVGWAIKKISEIAMIKAGGDKPKNYSDFSSEELSVPIYSNGISSEGLYGYTDVAIINEPSITVSARGTIGYSVLRLKPFVPIIRLLVLIPYKEHVLKFLEETIKRFSFENSGSVQQQLTVPQMSELLVLYPDDEILKIYAERMQPLIKKIELVKEQNSVLQQLRDWLLPLLMNGQVTVK
ncbi:restriction endonuclease subunit S [Citrobacter freundii]|uniref:Restriction endonuclease subunit S n=1 Tax=Citrobacter freundii TaxID=546 RepID=A0AAD1X085_CITFR|nr:MULTISPECIES: restriction endonuclease subunit S [Citrobacter]ASG42824.1 restriction endonuclease subunit S [Citrobacter freundii]EIJ8973208.1 restriction endonuclease subunit S [Citrobacter freundii]EIJ8978519.1 restriction endonuclease subunit S [Citrobacter freundii]EJD5384497.1 restriction endonuclease subunit S [Citrobacter freundii]EJG9714495.1 restriction endonuclease subunit S [Citrobacter freundii]